MPIRQPIVCVLGHVDTGKTLLLDKIRKTSVQAREAGGMTQHIGASFFPMETLKQMVGPLLSSVKGQIEIPGLLIVDTPGHEVFTNLRMRGGSVADIAIMVIDVLKGFEAQTYECIEILKSRKTPFLVAVNKIDRIPGWKPIEDAPFIKSYQLQDKYVREELDNKIYEIIGTFSRLGFNADRFDRIKDFTKTVALVPTSAKTGEGIPELLAVLVGLTQQYLKKRLQTTSGPAKGTVLEVKEEPGLGLTLNAIIYDGIIKRDDLIVIGGREKPIVTRVRALLVPKPLDEMRDPRDKFSSVESVSAAAGVKIAAPELEGVLAGAPIYVVGEGESPEKYVKLVSEEIERIRISTDVDGVIVKADTLGSLEAIAENLKRSNVPVRLADVGDVSKRDVTEAAVVRDHNPFYGAILAFNVKVLPDAAEEAQSKGIPIFQEKIIYHLVDNYVSWLRSQQEAKTVQEFSQLIKPAKIQILEGYVFRRAKPAIVGIEVLAGKIRPKLQLVRAEDGEEVGEILQIQDKGKAIPEAGEGMQVAISIDKPMVGRHIFEGDLLYVKVPEQDAKALLKNFIDRLAPEEQEALKEYVDLMRKKIPFWAA
ncbi:MAG: translation initiation factor IF-2 [Candidatus Bathyarchaeota archaeon]|nr:translation initiation factor IF-2 [Candidatus Bathyarchaeota archaeon]MCX8177565.1 translation initiation factor IF-2 [Candidatus Bathyarchaeota archaeon]MDW8194345.1 translation initiation factor IF-2 [Nitrososphaerota archaeon]